MKLTKPTFFLGCLVGGLAAGAWPLLINLFQSPAKAETKLLPFQGRLTDAAGNAVGDGAKVVEFKMYDAPTGGNVKWAGEVHKLSVNGGLVNTMLGSKAGLGSVDFAAGCFLQITVDANGDGSITAADPPLLPRQSVVPAVYAAVAGGMQYRVNATTVAMADWTAVFDNGRPDTGRIPTTKLAADNGVTATQIADNAVANAELADNAVELRNMANNSVGTAELIGAVVAGVETVPGAVNSDKIADGTIQTRDLSSGLQTSLVLPGTVVSYAGATVPANSGWLLCDGHEEPIANFQALAGVLGTKYGVPTQNPAATHFKLPDYRGLFLRGVDDPDGAAGLAAAGRDPDVAGRTAMASGGSAQGNVGSVQADDFRSHTHSSVGYAPIIAGGGVGAYTNSATGLPPAIIGSAGGNETRPKNAYVNYLIKY